MRAIITAPLLTQKTPPLLVLSACCKKKPSSTKNMLLLVAKRYAECKVVNQELFGCMRKFLSLKVLIYQNLDNK